VEERFLGKQWERKTGKVVWRGTAWFNGVGNTDLRPKLLGITKGKEWADVQDLQWVGVNGQKASNSLAIEEFCGYKYVIYTEVRIRSLFEGWSMRFGKERAGRNADDVMYYVGDYLFRPSAFPPSLRICHFDTTS